MSGIGVVVAVVVSVVVTVLGDVLLERRAHRKLARRPNVILFPPRWRGGR
jgi:hypothetical protein